MKTALEYDAEEGKFQPKLSILELVFTETKQAIGFAEFDLGAYTNKIKDSTVKTILDLKSEKFPGCQIYIYVNIQLLDPLPDKPSVKSSMGSLMPTAPGLGSSMLEGSVSQTFDPNQNAFEMKKGELLQEIKDLNEQKIKLEQEQERLQFQKKMAQAELCQEVPKLLLEKTNTMQDIKSKIEKYAKQESIIIKVL